MAIIRVESIRDAMPSALLGCELVQIDNSALNRTKWKIILKLARNFLQVGDEEGHEKLQLENDPEKAKQKWIEYCRDMDLDKNDEEFLHDKLVVIGGKTGVLTSSVFANDDFLQKAKLDMNNLDDQMPCIIDKDWFLARKQAIGNKTVKRQLADESLYLPPGKVLNSGGMQAGFKEEEAEEMTEEFERRIAEEKYQFKEELTEQSKLHQEELTQMKDYYEGRIDQLQKQQEYLTDQAEDYLKQAVQTETMDLRHELGREKAERREVQTNHEKFLSEFETMKTIQKQSQQTNLEMQRVIENLRNRLESQVNTSDRMEDSDSSDDEIAIPSEPVRRQTQRRICTMSASVPNTVTKLGIPVWNKANMSLLEHLAEFHSVMQEYAETDGTIADDTWKKLRPLLFQSIQGSRNIRLCDITTAERANFEKLSQKLVKMERGNPELLVEDFADAQIEQNETHKAYLSRVIHLYCFGFGVSVKDVETENFHCYQIFLKLKASLPSVAASKLVELSLDDVTKKELTIEKIRTFLEKILHIHRRAFETAMAEQTINKFNFESVNAVKQEKKFDNTNKVPFKGNCWKCRQPGHMAMNCTNDSQRESKTDGRRNQGKSKCHNCSGYGHFARSCPSKRQEHTKWSGEH